MFISVTNVENGEDEKKKKTQNKNELQNADKEKVLPIPVTILIEFQSLGNAIHSTFECLQFYILCIIYETQTHIIRNGFGINIRIK